jgi:hypothetical protein
LEAAATFLAAELPITIAKVLSRGASLTEDELSPLDDDHDALFGQA